MDKQDLETKDHSSPLTPWRPEMMDILTDGYRYCVKKEALIAESEILAIIVRRMLQQIHHITALHKG